MATITLTDTGNLIVRGVVIPPGALITLREDQRLEIVGVIIEHDEEQA